MQLSHHMWGREGTRVGWGNRIERKQICLDWNLFHCSEGWLHNTVFERLSLLHNSLHFLQNYPHQVRQFLHSVHWSFKKRPKSWLILFKLPQVATEGLISLTIVEFRNPEMVRVEKQGIRRLWHTDIACIHYTCMFDNQPYMLFSNSLSWFGRFVQYWM